MHNYKWLPQLYNITYLFSAGHNVVQAFSSTSPLVRHLISIQQKNEYMTVWQFSEAMSISVN